MRRLRSDIDEAFTAFDARTPLQPIAAAAPWYAPLEIDAGFEQPDPLGTAFLRKGGGVYAAERARERSSTTARRWLEPG